MECVYERQPLTMQEIRGHTERACEHARKQLAVVRDEIGRDEIEVERTIPQIQFADNTEIIKMPLSLRHIVAHESCPCHSRRYSRVSA